MSKGGLVLPFRLIKLKKCKVHTQMSSSGFCPLNLSQGEHPRLSGHLANLHLAERIYITSGKNTIQQYFPAHPLTSISRALA